MTAKSPSGLILLSLSLPVLLSSLGTSIANVALPDLAKAFSASFHDVQWIVLAYLLAITTLIVSVGRLGDLIGRRRLLLAGIAVFTLASGLGGTVSDLRLLIAARAFQGLGAAIMMTLGMAFVAETVPKARIGSAMGLLGTMSAIGTSLGPSLGGGLIYIWGWRAIFLVNLPLGIAALWLAFRALPADKPASKSERPRFDVWGTILLALTLCAYALAMTFGRGHFGGLNAALLLAALAGAAIFIWFEARTQSPLIPLTVFRENGLSSGLGMSALVSTVMMATLVVGPFYLSRALGLDAVHVGLVMSIGPVISVLSGFPAGRLVDRYGTRLMTIAGLTAMASGAVALCALPQLFGLTGYIVAIAMLTPGYQLFQAANNTSVMADIRPNQRGVISGVLNLSRNIGLITGASLMGAVFALASGTNDLTTARPESITHGMSLSFAVASGLIGLALSLALFGGRK